MTDDPRPARRPARYRDDAPLPQHFLDLATGKWVAAIVEWTPEGEKLRIDGGLATGPPGKQAARWRGRDEPPRRCQ